MGLFTKLFNKADKTEAKDILSIPCNYDGVDLVFEEGTTEPSVYSDINNLVTNGCVNIAEAEGYSALTKDSSNEEFYDFYDNWIELLTEKGFVADLTMSVDFTAFVNDINQILGNINAPQLLNAEETVRAYREEVVKYSFQGKPVDMSFQYDVLEANIVNSELEKIGYELIAFFNGVDNDAKTVIPSDKISLLKALEERIK